MSDVHDKLLANAITPPEPPAPDEEKAAKDPFERQKEEDLPKKQGSKKSLKKKASTKKRGRKPLAKKTKEEPKKKVSKRGRPAKKKAVGRPAGSKNKKATGHRKAVPAAETLAPAAGSSSPARGSLVKRLERLVEERKTQKKSYHNFSLRIPSELYDKVAALNVPNLNQFIVDLMTIYTEEIQPTSSAKK